MPGRNYSSNTYRYGFNGKENDNEVKNITGSQQDYGMRIYDPRLGKFLSVDPISYKYPWNSSYAFAENDVIRSVDLDGGERKFVFHEWSDGDVRITHIVSYKSVFPNSIRSYGDMGPGTLHFWSIGKELVRSLYDENDDLSSHFSSISLNFRGGGGAGPVAGSVGPSIEISDKSVAGSFNLDGSLNSQWKEKPALSASIDIGFKYSENEDNTIKSGLKGTSKLSDKTTINLFGTGVFWKIDVGLTTFDRTYRVGVDLGAKMNTPYSRTGSLTGGIKGVASENFTLTPPENTNKKEYYRHLKSLLI